ncbi:hypothetical protein ACJRO7_002436 [Eucalyptus globulus]|uniref:Dynamin GTPase effector domain-containing protein n=1 Tax=Eucalyptus globulus TaxID=34317 RepID=A0ABD3M495_EUCGL
MYGMNRPDMKLLILSAKLDAEKFSDFFHSTLIFRYAVRRYPIEILHTSAPEADYLDAAIQSECNLKEISDDDEPPIKGSKDKKSNGPDSGKGPGLVFKITSKVPHKTVLKAHSAVVLKAETMAEKVEWLNKLRNVVLPSTGGQMKGESGLPLRQSLSDGSLCSCRSSLKIELWWMSQEVRGYVEAVLNSLGANVPKAVVLCQVVKAKEDTLNQLYSSIRDLTAVLPILHSFPESPRSNGPSSGDDWRSAFDAASNGHTDYLGLGRATVGGTVTLLKMVTLARHQIPVADVHRIYYRLHPHSQVRLTDTRCLKIMMDNDSQGILVGWVSLLLVV